ncbi:12440_t:CDS:10 [Funneliformis mosseae]|uniref:DNA polymerase n=1 Tax=Funneliformis mosseae TaxID=27381 RepID=A0A9N9GFG3_FUNMO|nr:12440_t:CDS:10 [Funneliformis mosseae]
MAENLTKFNKRRQHASLSTNAVPSFEEQLALLQENELQESTNADERRHQIWERPNVQKVNPNQDSIIFQQIEVDDCVEPKSREPLIRMFGITETGNSVLCYVTGFRPYFYIPAPIGFRENDMATLQKQIERAINLDNGLNKPIERIELTLKESIWGYHGNKKSPYLKIIFSETKALNSARHILSIKYNDRQLRELTFESNINYVLRFMIDCKVTGANWIELPPKSYYLRNRFQKTSTCQLEIEINYPPENEWSKIAPLRILSFDIECAGRKGIFPEATKDPVIQIANTVTIQGEKNPFIRNVFTLNSCAPIVATDVIEFYDQGEMLQAWRDFVDPDVIIGYNIVNFDFPYLLERAQHLKVKEFPYFGRMKNIKTDAKDTKFSSKAYGSRRLQLDMLQVMQRDYKLRSYTLNSVCAHFLGEQKEEVHHSIITDLHNANSETRRRLAIYCLKDAILPQRLMDKLMCLINYMEMARVTGVPFNYLLVRGQQIKVISQLYRKAFEQDLVIPALKSEGSDDQYEGATVIEPERGFYNVPIATLDFSSLYPSIMIAHNLCYTTLLDNRDIENLGFKSDVDYTMTPYNNAKFVKVHHRKGLLPTILEDLLSARKKAKADLKKETDPFKKAVLDGRQLALKVSANSVYGFTGATVGKLPCIEISASVTAYGRQMIEKTKQEVENQYTIANGYQHDAHIIYGDTDSVMVKFGVDNLVDAMALGKEASDYVTEKFVKPIKLEFEKVYFPYLLINKKRYAGLYWTNPEKWDKLDTKGIETVRRDNCLLVQNVIETSLRKMLIDRDVAGAEEYVKKTISDLLQNKIDMSQLVITKALSKSDYSAKQPHVELAERMRKRDAGSAPTLGDRVAYVIVKSTKGAAAYEKSEDPIYVLENNIPIDTNYYLENQLSKPLLRIFEPVLGEKAHSLLAGDHTRVVQIATPTIGGLMKFTVKTATCLGCKTPLSKHDTAVCRHCKPKLGELYQRQLDAVNKLEVHFSRLWTQCQRCQGSLHQDILCSSKDCPIWYMRKKAQKDVQDAATLLERFNYAW